MVISDDAFWQMKRWWLDTPNLNIILPTERFVVLYRGGHTVHLHFNNLIRQKYIYIQIS
jgi:hypothetical protein